MSEALRCILKCPYCGACEISAVVDSRGSEDFSFIRRRRLCMTCGKRVTTYEHIGKDKFDKDAVIKVERAKWVRVANALRYTDADKVDAELRTERDSVINELLGMLEK